MKLLREDGYTVDRAEHWNSFTSQRKDLFGFIDLVAVGNGECLGVQTTSAANASARIRKIKESEFAVEWVKVPSNRIIVHGWRKAPLKKGGKALRWRCNVWEMTWDGDEWVSIRVEQGEDGL